LYGAGIVVDLLVERAFAMRSSPVVFVLGKFIRRRQAFELNRGRQYFPLCSFVLAKPVFECLAIDACRLRRICTRLDDASIFYTNGAMLQDRALLK
jgi:hypothetical protein